MSGGVVSVSPRGRAFIAAWEGTRLAPYNDANGFATVGVGHLLHRSPVTAADRARFAGFTELDALELLAHDLATPTSALRSLVVPPLTMQSHFDALASFVFNVGVGNFMRSQLLALLNRGLRGVVIERELLRWDHDARGNELLGLRRRRVAEAATWHAATYPLP